MWQLSSKSIFCFKDSQIPSACSIFFFFSINLAPRFQTDGKLQEFFVSLLCFITQKL